MPFGMITPEMLAAFWAQQGITTQPPDTEPAPPPEPIVCEICETELDDPSVEIEGPFGLKRYFHTVCLTMHLIRNEDNQNDELTALVTRKIPCTTAQ